MDTWIERKTKTFVSATILQLLGSTVLPYQAFMWYRGQVAVVTFHRCSRTMVHINAVPALFQGICKIQHAIHVHPVIMRNRSNLAVISLIVRCPALVRSIPPHIPPHYCETPLLYRQQCREITGLNDPLVDTDPS